MIKLDTDSYLEVSRAVVVDDDVGGAVVMLGCDYLLDCSCELHAAVAVEGVPSGEPGFAAAVCAEDWIHLRNLPIQRRRDGPNRPTHHWPHYLARCW